MKSNYLGIDIGGTEIKYGVINEDGIIVEFLSQSTPRNLDELKILLLSIISNRLSLIRGVGISVPGKVDVLNGVVHNGGSLEYLHEFKIKNFIESHFDLLVFVQNDGKAAVLGEYWKGNLKGVRSGAGIILGTGVGGGIIIDGKIFQGENYQAGEFSFMLNSSGKVSEDSLIGMSASSVKFINNANKLLKNPDINDGLYVFEQLENNPNNKLLNLFNAYCDQIVFIIFNIQAILDVKKIVIGGGISNQPLLITSLKKNYERYKKNHELFDNTLKSVEIEECKFKGQANLIGAVYPFYVN